MLGWAVEEDEVGTGGEDGDDDKNEHTGVCAEGFACVSLSEVSSSISPPCTGSSLDAWLDLDLPRSDRSRGPSYTSLSPSPKTFSVLGGDVGTSFTSLALG